MKRPQLEPKGFKSWTFKLSIVMIVVGTAIDLLNLYADKLGTHGAAAIATLGAIYTVLRIIRQGGLAGGHEGTNTGGRAGGSRGRDPSSGTGGSS